MRDVEQRYMRRDWGAAPRLRAVEDSDRRPVLRGTAIVFNSRSLDLGGFVERIDPRAIERTLSEAIDLRALVDHDTSKVIGRLSANTLRVSTDSDGLHVEIHPPNTSVGRDIVESVRRGDIDEMSFAFRVMEDDVNTDVDPPVRTILDMRVREVSVVAFGAYPATDVELAHRSLTRAREQHARVRVPALRVRLDELIAKWNA